MKKVNYYLILTCICMPLQAMRPKIEEKQQTFDLGPLIVKVLHQIDQAKQKKKKVIEDALDEWEGTDKYWFDPREINEEKRNHLKIRLKKKLSKKEKELSQKKYSFSVMGFNPKKMRKKDKPVGYWQ